MGFQPTFRLTEMFGYVVLSYFDLWTDKHTQLTVKLLKTSFYPFSDPKIMLIKITENFFEGLSSKYLKERKEAEYLHCSLDRTLPD
jgi:hypothetical protein